MTTRPTIVGECNPYGGDDQFALYPAPDGCSGHRLCHLIFGMRRAQYLDAFDRVNLCSGKWGMRAARGRANELCASTERLILLGAKVSAAFCMPFRAFEITRLADAPDVENRNRSVLVLPHPSGRNLLWNEPGAFQRARDAVRMFAPELSALLGATGALREDAE